MVHGRWCEYVDSFEHGDIKTRREVAQEFGVGWSTARYHLDRAVEAGFLNRQFGWTGKQTGWLYGLPCTIPKLIEDE